LDEAKESAQSRGKEVENLVFSVAPDQPPKATLNREHNERPVRRQ
jgi:hypothetical protein